MRTALLGSVVCVALLLSGCGNEQVPRTSPRPSRTACPVTPVPLVKADLDGDGVLDQVTYDPPVGTCPASLSSSVNGLHHPATIDWDALGARGSAMAVRVPGRRGDLVLLRQQHARGGFQAHLYGYARGALEELTAEGRPIFDFIATDVTTSPTAATCTRDGFEITRALAHQPIGVMPAWDVERTTYTVDGNTVTKGVTVEIADNVLDADLHRRYADLVSHQLFRDCRVAQ